MEIKLGHSHVYIYIYTYIHGWIAHIVMYTTDIGAVAMQRYDLSLNYTISLDAHTEPYLHVLLHVQYVPCLNCTVCMVL